MLPGTLECPDTTTQANKYARMFGDTASSLLVSCSTSPKVPLKAGGCCITQSEPDADNTGICTGRQQWVHGCTRRLSVQTELGDTTTRKLIDAAAAHLLQIS
jgi:hypothetical protein